MIYSCGGGEGWGGRAGVAAAKCGSARLWSARLAAPPHSMRLWCGGLIILDILLYTVLWTCDLSLTGEGNYQVGESMATMFIFHIYIYIHSLCWWREMPVQQSEAMPYFPRTYIHEYAHYIQLSYAFSPHIFSRLNTHDRHTDGSIPLAISCDRLGNIDTSQSCT